MIKISVIVAGLTRLLHFPPGHFATTSRALLLQRLLLALLLLGGAGIAEATIPAAERTVLTNLYASTNGASWTTRTGWMGTAGTECSWYGVQCDGSQTHVVQIALAANNLAGTLPSLSSLTALQYFNVGSNHLTGSIPSLSGLTALQLFWVTDNQLTGPIPSPAGLTALENFHVARNQLSGSIPAFTGLSQLWNVSVNDNRLTGSFPSLSGLPLLISFYAQNNQLTGSLPSLAGLPLLSFFDVSNNRLSGPVPNPPPRAAAGRSNLCINGFISSGNPTVDAAWVTAQDPAAAAGGNWLACQTLSSPPTCTLTATPPSIAAGGTVTLTVGCSPAALSYSWSANTGFGSATTTGTVSPTATTTYSVTGSNGGGTGNTASVTVTVGTSPSPAPICTLTATPSTIVAGGTATLSVSCSPAAVSYAWSANTGFGSATTTGTVSPTATTTYSVIGSNANGPGNTASVTVTIASLPVCTLTASPASIAAGGTATLSASCSPTAASYAWTGGTCGGTAGPTCTARPSATTTYTVAGRNSSGFGPAAVASVTVIAPAFPISVTADIGPTVATVTATIQFRPEDVGPATNVYSFALAPATLLKSGSSDGDESLPLGYARAADGTKDTSVACVLAQLNSSGQLKQVTASSMQAYLTGVLGSQSQVVQVINGVATANIAGATFYVGYGTSAAAMFASGTNAGVIVVGAERTCQPQAPHTGWWWNAYQGGRGYSIEAQGRNLFMAAYLYDVSGRATWYVAAGPTSLDGSLFTGALMSFGGGVSLSGAYRPNNRLPDAGAISLAFDDAAHGTLVWPGGSVALVRYGFGRYGPDTPALANQPESGWWWGGTGDNGRGFFIEWQGDRAYLAGYMYDSDGNAIWYAADSPVTNAQTFRGTWLQFANGQTLTDANRAPTIANANVAPVTIHFEGADSALLTLPTGTLPITRFRF